MANRKAQIRDLKLNDLFRLDWDDDGADGRIVYLVTNISGTGDQRTIHATGRTKHQIFWPHTYDFPIVKI